jgi:hypothetical protein
MAIFTNASFLGVDQRGEFFGDSARYKTVKTLSIEGFVDSRASNTDVAGVAETVNTIKTLISSVNSEKVMEVITINGSGYGTGKIISLEFQASPNATSSQVQVGHYSAQIELYSAGDLLSNTVMDGVTVPYPELLEDFSETYSFSRDEEDNYDYNHDLSIKYISGIGSNGTAIDPIAQSKILAGNIYSQTLISFNGRLGTSADYDSAGKTYHTEAYDTINGSTNYTKKKKFLKSIHAGAPASYAFKVSNVFSMGEDGNVTVSEKGEVMGRAGDILTSSKAGMETEIANSFARCSSVYDIYIKEIGAISHKATYSTNALNSIVVSVSRNIDNNIGSVSYDVTYTDDVNMSNVNYLTDRKMELNKKGNVYSISENATLTSYFPKGVLWLPAGVEAVTEIPAAATAKSRCLSFYTDSGGTSSTLNLLSSASEIPKYGKQFSYTYKFTDDPEVLTDVAGRFNKKHMKSSDKPGIVAIKGYIIPNTTYEFIHLPGQTSIGIRTIEISAQLKRVAYTNNLKTFRDPISAVKELKAEMITEAYKVFVDNPIIRTSDASVIRVSNASYEFTSNNEINMTIEAQYVMERIPNGDYRILL